MNAKKTTNYFIHSISTLRGTSGMAHRRVQRLYALRLRDYYRNGRNSPRRWDCIDIFMESYEDAIEFGRRHKEVYVKR